MPTDLPLRQIFENKVANHNGLPINYRNYRKFVVGQSLREGRFDLNAYTTYLRSNPRNPPFPKKSEAWVPFIILSLRTVCPTLRASAETALPCSSAESWSSSVSGSSQRTTCPSLNEWITRSPALTFSFHARDPDFLRLCRNSSSGCRRDHWLASLSRFSRHWMVTPSGCKAAAERTIQSPESVLRSVFISFRSSSNTARSCAKASFPSSSYRSSILRTLQHRAVRS